MKVCKPKEGFIWNPLRNFPRNSPCPCKSGKKFKKCHYKMMTLTIPIAALKKAAS